jgi:glycosyltransferase involved in cell wall biosynthesis
MKKILYACVCNNGGMLRVAQWCQRFSTESEEMIFLIFTNKKFEETENLKCIEWEEDNTIFSKEKIEHFGNEIQKKIDLSQIRCMIGDYLTLSYFERFQIPFFYDVHILAKPMHEKIHLERRLVAMDNDLLTIPLNTMIDVISMNFMKFENKWIRQAKGYFVNSKASETHIKSYYRDEIQGKPVYFIPLSGVEEAAEVTPYSQRNFEYPFFAFARLHPQKGYHFLFYQNWKDKPLFVRGVDPTHIKPTGHGLLQKNSITILGWTSQLETLKQDILKSRFVLFPSIYEPFGLALQEALSFGAICICHKNNSGHEEQVRHGENGFLIDMGQKDWMLELDKLMLTPMEELDKISLNAMKGTRKGDGERNKVLRATIQQETFFLSEK